MKFEKLIEGDLIRARIDDQVLYEGKYVARQDRFFKIETSTHEIVFDGFHYEIDVQKDGDWEYLGRPSDDE